MLSQRATFTRYPEAADPSRIWGELNVTSGDGEPVRDCFHCFTHSVWAKPSFSISCVHWPAAALHASSLVKPGTAAIATVPLPGRGVTFGFVMLPLFMRL